MDYYARVHPDLFGIVTDRRSASLSFKASPPDQPWIGWQKVTPEQASHLRQQLLNNANPTASPKVFQVVNEEEYTDIVKEGRKGASKYLDPIATAQIANLQEELDKVKGMAAENAAKDAKLSALEASQAQMTAQFTALMAMIQSGQIALPAGQNAASVVPAPVVAPKVDPLPESPAKVDAVPTVEKSAAPTITGTPRPGRKPSKVDVVIPSDTPAPIANATAIEKPSDATDSLPL